MTTELCELAVKHGTDKVIWGYTPTYYTLLAPRREQVKRVLEIGICGERDIPNNHTGASLYVWSEFFPNAEIIGIDIDPKWMVNDGRIKSLCVDAYNSGKLDSALAGFDQFDFICDDAVHDPIPQIGLLHDLWPRLAENGLYAIEDVCPYKLPHSDLQHMIRHFPAGAKTSIVTTHKDERLLLLRKN